MSNKTKKKKLVIEWPTSFFSIQDIQDKYPDAVNITLRFRITKAQENGDITLIGQTPKAVGRPTIMFAPEPITNELLTAAEEAGVQLDDEFRSRTVEVAKVENVEVPTTTTTPVTTTVKVEETA